MISLGRTLGGTGLGFVKGDPFPTQVSRTCLAHILAAMASLHGAQRSFLFDGIRSFVDRLSSEVHAQFEKSEFVTWYGPSLQVISTREAEWRI